MLLRKTAMLILVASAVTLSACTTKKVETKQTTYTIDTRTILANKSLSQSDKAEELALAAEQLLTPASFMYADEVASIALALDKNNKRAQLIRVLVGPAMASEGILERVKPLANRNARSKELFAATLKQVNEYPNSAVKTFLLNSKVQDIKDEASAQSYLKAILVKFEDQRAWFKANKNTEMTLHIPDTFQWRTLIHNARTCTTSRHSPERLPTYDYNWETGEVKETPVISVTCDFSHIYELKANQADWEAAQHIAAGSEIYALLATAYDLSGAIKVGDDNYDNYKYGTIVKRAVANQLLKNKSFGQLLEGKGMRGILALGLDGIAGVRWAQKLQKELCPNGNEIQHGLYGKEILNRPGYAFSRGICVDDDNVVLTENNPNWSTVGDVLKITEMALRGNVINMIFTGPVSEMQSQMKPSELFTNPIKDIGALAPLKWDRCDQIVGTNDATLGGVFVKGDANAVLALNRNSCEFIPGMGYSNGPRAR